TADDHSFCAFADDGCAPSKMRFGDAAGAVAGTCAGGVTPAGRGPDVCLPGARFPPTFSACTQDVCEYLPGCCASSWTPACVSAAEARCQVACGRQIAFAGKGVVAVVADDDGDGTFTVVASTGTAGHPYAEVRWADLDGDATPELVIATADLNA